jgi:hypothetical protein
MLTDDEREAAGSDPATGRLACTPEETTPLVFVEVREEELVAGPLSILPVRRRRRPDPELTVITSLPEAAFYTISVGRPTGRTSRAGMSLREARRREGIRRLSSECGIPALLRTNLSGQLGMWVERSVVSELFVVGLRDPFGFC